MTDPWQPWLGNMGQKRAPLGLNQGDMGEKKKKKKKKKHYAFWKKYKLMLESKIM